MSKKLFYKILRRSIYEVRKNIELKDISKLKKSIDDCGVINKKIDAKNIRNKRLAAMLNYSKKNVPYYKNLLADIGCISKDNVLEVMQRLPILTRELIFDNNKELVSKKSFFYPSSISKTSGTTGIPLEFLASAPNGEFSHQRFLYEFMAKERIDFNRIISFGGAYFPEEMVNNNIFWTEDKKATIYGKVLFSSFYFLEKNMEVIVNKLEEIQPQIIRSYPSCILLFIDYCEKLHIKPRINAKGIYVTSENSTKEQLEKISNFFSCGVYGQYGHSEACVFAFTLKNDTTYYCSPFYGYVEVLNENDEHVKPGETGYVTVTTMRNKVMPFIRYRMGDLAVYGGEENGYVVLSRLIGREKDYILNKDNEKIFLIVGQFSECFLPAICHVKYWQAIQDNIGEMHLKIVKKDIYTEKDEKDILEVTKNNKIETTIEYVNDIPLTKAGKRKYIINSLY